MNPQSITIAIEGRSDGPAFSPGQVPLAVLREFTLDVEAFLKGDGKEIDSALLEVSVVEGSLALQTVPIYAPVLFRDITLLAQTEALDQLDPKRRSIIERWQKIAGKSKNRQYRIESVLLKHPVIISSQTDFHSNDADQWVSVERYVRGEITDLGGVSKVNAHIRLPDGRILTASTERELLRADKINRLFKPALVRIRAEYNVLTKELREVQLIEFLDYAPSFDEEAFSRLTERGAEAWKDVTDATEWVDDLRGGKH